MQVIGGHVFVNLKQHQASDSGELNTYLKLNAKVAKVDEMKAGLCLDLGGIEKKTRPANQKPGGKEERQDLRAENKDVSRLL